MCRQWGKLGVLVSFLAVAAGCIMLAPKEEPATLEVLVTEAPAAQPAFAMRVNAGMNEPYTDKSGEAWLPDQLYEEGEKYGFVPGEGGGTVDRGTSVQIEGTDDPRIYQTERWLMEKFVAVVPNGAYTVILHFAETYPDIGTDGPRVFDVSIEDKAVLTDFDVSKTAGGVQKAVVKKFPGVEVSDGKLDIGFVRKQQNPEINGIEILAE